MNEKRKILIVEDDVEASFLMQNFLENCNYCVNCVETVTDGISYLKNEQYDLLLLDLNLPDFSGLDLLSTIQNSITIPILVVSAYNDTETKIQAFKYGAIDYITKPINFLELEARIEAQLNRIENTNSSNKKINPIFNIFNNQVLFKDEAILLTSTEFSILKVFIEYKNIVVSRDHLVDLIPSIKSHRLLDNHIKNIRNKIEHNSKTPQYLTTIYAQGYKLVF